MRKFNFLKKLANTPPCGFRGASRVLGLILVLLTLGVGNVWGEDATFSISGKSGSSSPYTVTGSLSGAPTGATASCNSTYNDKNQLTNGKTQTLTLYGFDGCTITGVTINMKRSNTSGVTGTINVTVNDNIKLVNNYSQSLTTTAGNKVMTLANTTTVVGSGKTIVITVKASANSAYVYSYKISYTPAGDPHTVFFSTGTGNPAVASRTEASSAAGITLPSTSDLSPTCSGDGWTLYGWATAAYGSSSTTTAPTTTLAGLAGATYYPTDDVTLHAVYVKSVTEGDPVAQTLTFDYSSTNWTKYHYTNKSTYWLIHGNDGYVESPIIADLSTITSITVHAGYYGGSAYGKFQLSGAGTNYGNEQSCSNNSESTLKTINPSTNPLSGSGRIKLQCTGTASNDNGLRLKDITINYTAPPTTYYYWSAPNCCTELGTINGSFSWSNVSPTSVTIGVPSDYSDKDNEDLVGYIFKRYTASTGGDAVETHETNLSSETTATFNTDLVANTTYYYTITAKHSSSSCNSEETSPRKSYAISSYVVSYAAGDGSGNNPGAHDPVLSGGKVTLKSNTFTAPEGQQFTQWNDGSSNYGAEAQYTVTGNKTMTAQWECVTPSISVHPVNGSCVQGGSPSALTVTATGGTLAYQWKQCATIDGSYTNAEGGSGATTASYTPPTTDAGTLYYKCEVKNTGSSCNITALSNAASFIVSAASQCVTPSFSPAGGTYSAAQNVTITSTEGATIYYTTNGDEPTTSSSVYSSPIAVSANTTIKAYAVKSGMTDSEVGTAVYNIRCAQPTFTPAAGTHNEAKSVTISCATEGATIYYTTDGSDPDDGSTEYTGAISVSSTQTIKAIAYKTGMTESEVNSAAYELKCATPTITAGGTFTDSKNVELSCATEGATIRYTTDGSEPTTGSTVYLETISVTSTTTIKAKAFKDGWTASDEASATYTIQYSVTWKVNGAALTGAALGSATVLVNAGGKVANFPNVADDALGNDDQKFMGWTAGSELTGTGNSAPGDLFTVSTGTKPTINAPAVYHAVFATEGEAGNPYYQKVTATGDITNDGRYLIVYETDNIAFDGSLESIGDASNYIDVATISSNKITPADDEARAAHAAAEFTIDMTNKYVKSASNKYINQTGWSNGLSGSASASALHSISIDGSGNFVVEGTGKSGSTYVQLRFNSASGSSNYRFRFYKEGQEDIQLYKYTSAAPTYSDYITKVVALSSIAVTTPPTKTVYKKGETLNLDGMVVTATYADASSHAVTGYTVSPTTETALATSDVKFTVSYTENEVNKTADQTIKVYALDKIEVTTAPSKTTYQEGDSFDKTGMVVTATWGTGADKIVETLAASAYTVTPSTFSSTSTTSVTISYTHQGVEKTTTQAVTVSEKPSKTMTWHVANEDAFTTKIYINAQDKYILAFPETPDPQSVGFSSDYVFKGWTTANSIKKDGTTDGATPIVYAAAGAEMENNEDFYAVFALATEDYNTIFSETFDDCNGTGGNDGSWSGSIASSDLPSSLSSWSCTKGYAAKECIKLGGSDKLGSAQTPSISVTGSAALSFKAAAWNSGSEQTTLKLSVTSGTLSASSVTIKKGEWDNFSVTITGINTSTIITFEGKQASNSRFFLDDVVVKTPVVTYSDYRLAPSAVKTPTIGLAAGTYYGAQTVTLSQADSKPIYYTLDGTTPTTASASGTSVTLNEAGTKTLKAIAYDESTEDYSQMASAEYTVVMEIADPVLPASGKFFENSKSVTITHDLTAEGAVIHYSYDDATYNTYSEALVITETKTVWAYVTIGNLTSEKVSATYTKGETVVYTKVTSESDLAAGMQFVIVANTNKVAGEPYSTTANTYLKYVEITPSENTLSVGSQAVQVFQLDREPGAWSLGIGEGIFLIPSGGDVKVSNATSGEWSIAIDGDGKPEITCTGNNSNTKLQYNLSSPRFKTYSNQTDLDNIYAAPHTAYTLTYDVEGTDLAFKVVAGYEYTITNTTCGTAPANCEFLNKWTDGTNVYAIGDKITLTEDVTLIPCWKLTQTADVDIDALPAGVTEIVVTDGKTLEISAGRSLDNLTVEAGGEVDGTGNLTVNNLTINSQSGASGQFTGTGNVTINGDLILEIKLDESGTMDPTKYYCISAPFDVAAFEWGNGSPMVFNVDYQLFKYDGDKRARTGNGWQRVGGTMEANTAYFIVFDSDNTTRNQNVIRLKAANKTIPTTTSITLEGHEATYGQDDEERTKNSNWNGHGNPTLHYVGVDKTVSVFEPSQQGFDPWVEHGNSNNGFVVGTAFFVKGTGTLSCNETVNGTVRAPRREGATNYTYCVEITKENANRYDNRLYVMASETASTSFEEGKDLPTLNGETSNYGALIWTKNYGMRLAVEEAPMVNKKATYELGIFAPSAGMYTISVAAPQENAELYLTKNGHIIWNLSMSPCEIELPQGQNNEYGLVLRAKAPSTATGVENTEVSDQNSDVQKVIIDEHVYILRGGEMYDVTGKMVR